MKKNLRYVLRTGICLAVLFYLCAGLSVYAGQSPAEELRAEVDVLVSAAYELAAEKLPCKVKPRGKAKMLKWEDVDKCLHKANERVDWEELARKLDIILQDNRFQRVDVIAAVESSLSAHAMPYDKVFRVKNMEALLPLTNSVLNFLPPESLMDLPVHDKSGERMGTFSGKYAYDRGGGLTMANSFSISHFQYTDLKGRMQAPTTKLLLDSFGVPWKGARSQPGFRLPADELLSKR
jgi:hypothetical protein